MTREKFLFRISSKIIRAMCLTGRSFSNLQVRPRCQTVLLDAVRSTNTPPACVLPSKESSIFCPSKTVWFTADIPYRKPACSPWELWIDNCFHTGGDKPFEDVVGNTKQRYWAIALGVLYRLLWHWDCDYQRSSQDFGKFEPTQAGRKKTT